LYIENKRTGFRLNLLVPVGLLTVFLINGFFPSLVMLLAAAFHEAGHILCALVVGAPIVRVDIELWGGRMYYGGMLGYKQEILVSLGGIIANLLVAPLGLIPIFGMYGKLFYYSCFCYALVNIIPVKSLDGGELFRCVMRLISDPFTAERAENVVNVFSVLFFVVAGLMVSLISGFNSSVVFLVFFSVIVFATEQKKTWC